MSERLFTKTSFQNPELPSQWSVGYRVGCQCGTEAIVPTGTRSGLPDEVLNKKFLQLGWTIGSGPTKHKCPSCSKKRRPVEVTAPPPISPPRDIISFARKRAEREFESIGIPAVPTPVSPSMHAASVDEARALIALARETVRSIDDTIEAAIVQAEAMKQPMIEQIAALERKFLVDGAHR